MQEPLILLEPFPQLSVTFQLALQPLPSSMDKNVSTVNSPTFSISLTKSVLPAKPQSNSTPLSKYANPSTTLLLLKYPYLTLILEPPVKTMQELPPL